MKRNLSSTASEHRSTVVDFTASFQDRSIDDCLRSIPATPHLCQFRPSRGSAGRHTGGQNACRRLRTRLLPLKIEAAFPGLCSTSTFAHANSSVDSRPVAQSRGAACTGDRHAGCPTCRRRRWRASERRTHHDRRPGIRGLEPHGESPSCRRPTSTDSGRRGFGLSGSTSTRSVRPTRAALLTGRYPLRCGVWGVTHNKEAMRPERSHVGRGTAGRGYRTAASASGTTASSSPITPPGQGFDEFFGFHNGHINNYFDTELLRGSQPVATDGLHHRRADGRGDSLHRSRA